MERALLACSLALSSAILGAAAPQVNDPRAVQLLERVDDLWRGESSKARMVMRVKTKRYERTLKLEGWSLGTAYSLVRILEPQKEAGTSTLKAGDTIYTYLPRTDRSIKLSGGMMGGSWMGSHFTNDDLVQQSRLSRDYDVTIAFEGVRDGRRVVDMELIPKPKAAVVWGKIKTSIDAATLFPVKTTYFDEDFKAVREMGFFDVKPLGGRERPSRMRLNPLEEAGEYTELVYEALDPKPGIGKDFFSLSRLKRR